MPGKSDKPQKGNVVESSYYMKHGDGKMNKSAKKFEPHKMYCKDGTVHNAKTYKQHLALKNKGCGHKPMKKK